MLEVKQAKDNDDTYQNRLGIISVSTISTWCFFNNNTKQDRPANNSIHYSDVIMSAMAFQIIGV